MRRLSLGQIGSLVLLVASVMIVAALRMLIYRDTDGELTFSWADANIAALRWTSVSVAAIVGAALAVSGVLLQALLRNPLASPFILGISSGAGLGVMAAIYLAHPEVLRTGSAAAPALLGGMLTLGIVYLLGQRRGLLDPLSVVLVGVVVSAICGALIMFLQHMVPQGLRGDLPTWMMGHIRQGISAGTLLVVGGMVMLGIVVAAFLGRAMDAATLGDDEARTVGLAIGRLRLGLFLLAGALTALAVAIAGPIAFVGLIAPHAARLLLGPRHTILVIGATLVGISLLIGSDVASQAINVGGGRMPAGVFTALIGGPTFIWLLRSGKGQA